jgi:hypothetical protein
MIPFDANPHTNKVNFSHFSITFSLKIADLSGTNLDFIDGIYAGVWSDVQQGVARP